MGAKDDIRLRGHQGLVLVEEHGSCAELNRLVDCRPGETRAELGRVAEDSVELGFLLAL